MTWARFPWKSRYVTKMICYTFFLYIGKYITNNKNINVRWKYEYKVRLFRLQVELPSPSMSVIYNYTMQNKFSKWAASWQNQQNDCAPSEDSDQPGHPPNLIRVFAVRMKKAWVLSYPLSAQRRLWSDWTDAQADLSLRWAHTHFVGFVTMRLKCFCMCQTHHTRLSFSVYCNKIQAPTTLEGIPGKTIQGWSIAAVVLAWRQLLRQRT